MPSFNAAGADSTKSLASFKPKPVAPRTALITATLFAPALARITSNSVFSSAAAAPAAGAAATAAAAETPNFSSIAAINSTISDTDFEAIASINCSLVNDMTINS
ncbi:50S ribosomal protein L7/L12 [Actinobacillus suis H91-0380]|uniref:50S ribosomal protein L7/L12 n=1 Tax=Actinobacillus suis H91-0380 TaxID=696748 RepID=K0G6X0_ACTSU|nr:50S ribosomal protein L7/L12 [Actinobacillus suis H91-0380]